MYAEKAEVPFHTDLFRPLQPTCVVIVVETVIYSLSHLSHIPTGEMFAICTPSLVSTSNFSMASGQMMVMLDLSLHTAQLSEVGEEIAEHLGIV